MCGVNVGLGVSDHSGWAVMVAVGGDRNEVAVIDRRRLELCDPALPRQAYHAAEHLALDEASTVVASVERSARTAAAEALGALVDELTRAGHDVSALAVAEGTAPVPDDLARILASHALLHAAEGQLFRDALVDGAAHASVDVVRFAKRTLAAEAADALGRDADQLVAEIAALGRPIGPPWRQDHKTAALAGWLALATR